MGRRAFMNRLTLGRSPYEAPEFDATGSSTPVQRRNAALHADGYVQHYDERGHPVNPEAKKLGRELRRAKNDILSTMGVVVSGEDGNLGTSSEQQKIGLIATENDYGLVMATLDQILVFLCSWWTSSLAGRIQTFSSYTRAPLMSIVRLERASVGVPAFYLAGIPAWTVSSCLSICRYHPLERFFFFIQTPWLQQSTNDVHSRGIRSIFSVLNSMAKGTLLVMSVQAYMHSLLQSLHLIPPFSMQGSRILIPSMNFLPPFPKTPSFRSLGGFLLGLLKAPPLLVCLYVYLRPMLEVRVYRIIRRRLPKPSLADEQSVKVAYENDLIDWMVPSLGRRAEEENRRSRLTLFEDVKYEVSVFGRWLISWFSFDHRRRSDRKTKLRTREVRLQSLRRRIEELQSELGAAQSRTRMLPQPIAEPSRSTRNESTGGRDGDTQTGPPLNSQPSPRAVDSLFNMDQVFSNEENRISQSPVEMGDEYFADMASEASEAAAPTADLPHRSANGATQAGDESHANRLASRSNNLISPLSSPETSLPTSPRVRASLIHRSSDVITMQLELLTNRDGQTSNRTNDATGNESTGISHVDVPNDRRSITEFLDTLLSNQGASISAHNPSGVGENDGFSNLTSAAVPAARDNQSTPIIESQPHEIPAVNDPAFDIAADAPLTGLANILPDSVEEPSNENDNEHEHEHENENDPFPEADTGLENQPDMETRLPPTRSTARPRSMATNLPPLAHRVTALSAQPVDSVASHLASMITTALFIPLESLYLRSLASAYLSYRASPSALRHDIRPLGAWAGGGSLGDALAYVGKLTVLTGIQAALNCGVWSTVTGAVIYIGRRFCGWGSL